VTFLVTFLVLVKITVKKLPNLDSITF